MPDFVAPKGVPDYYPPVSRSFEAVKRTLLAAADRAGYGTIELPVFEDTGLFARGVGESTDVVSKEMYTFADRGGRSVTLRPEGTAGVMRAVIEHSLDRGPLPIKLVYAGAFFRYERPQAGRYRQLQQVGIEAIGSDDPALDAEVIAVADEGYRDNRLTAFLATLELDEATRERAVQNPLRVLDDKRPAMQALLADAPLMIDYLCDDCRAHFDQVRVVLDALAVPYELNPRMVRGLDYYTRTTFEFVHPGLGAQSGIGGGGRYDGLMAELGGQSLSGIGFGLGVDRTLLASQAEGVLVGGQSRCEVYGVPMGAAASQRLAAISGELRRAGIRADMAYGGRALKTAMKAADASGARVALVLGERELQEGTVMVRDLTSGEQNPCQLGDVVEAVRSILR